MPDLITVKGDPGYDERARVIQAVGASVLNFAALQQAEGDGAEHLLLSTLSGMQVMICNHQPNEWVIQVRVPSSGSPTGDMQAIERMVLPSEQP
jgi:hypothetical protein